jgi:hypothetical protein
MHRVDKLVFFVAIVLAGAIMAPCQIQPTPTAIPEPPFRYLDTLLPQAELAMVGSVSHISERWVESFADEQSLFTTMTLR